VFELIAVRAGEREEQGTSWWEGSGELGKGVLQRSEEGEF